LPELKTRTGSHYADVLEHLFAKRLAALAKDRALQDGGQEGPSRSPVELVSDDTGPRGHEARVPRQTLPSASDGASPRHQAQGFSSPTPADAAPDATWAQPIGEEKTAPPATVADCPPVGHGTAPQSSQIPPDETAPLAPSKIAPGPRIDKSRLAHGTVRRLRDPDHRKFVAAQPCLVCGREPAHAHHLRFAQSRGLSLKVSDEFTVPLCALHHGDLHRSGSELEWWARHGLNPHPVAAELWAKSHPVPHPELPDTPKLASTSKPRGTLVPPH
jgi:hypothetical protein